MDEDLVKMLKYIKLPGLLANWDQYIQECGNKNYSHTHLLKMIVKKEYSIKMENARNMRISRAKVPEKYVLETFPFDRQPKLSRKKTINIYESGYLDEKRNVIWVGSTGTGKTGLATSFLMQAMHQGYSGLFIPFCELVEMLYRSVADHTEARLIKKFSSIDCLLIDELGYVEVEPVQVGLFFTLMQKRHKKKSTLITSNLGFSQWTSFLKNNQLTVALIDRLTENSYVFNMKGCVSLRPKLNEDQTLP